eukprot:7273724-Karenia_brevis.AAC.1
MRSPLRKRWMRMVLLMERRAWPAPSTKRQPKAPKCFACCTRDLWRKLPGEKSRAARQKFSTGSTVTTRRL